VLVDDKKDIASFKDFSLKEV